ncbi:MAG: SDR family oxidoreductase [Verrucomicrobia bacterium]|nr:SDR family oxidoreductase [Verrucomicrobiota bacterium]
MKTLVTGATGTLGSALLTALAGLDVTVLARHPQTRVKQRQIQGELHADAIADRDWDLIIHAAANTGFRSPPAELEKANVEGTAELIRLATECPRLSRFIYLSSTCAFGYTEGTLREQCIPQRPSFANFYEETKWRAEQLVTASGLPFQILRIPIVLGSRLTGEIARPAAIHHALRWLTQGLVPLLPTRTGCKLEIISTEAVTEGVQRALEQTTPSSHPFLHICRGESAPELTDLLNYLGEWLKSRDRRWAEEVFTLPNLVTPDDFAEFRRLIDNTANPLFRTIYHTTDVLESALTSVRTFVVSATAVDQEDWVELANAVFDHQLTPLLDSPYANCIN